MARAAGFTFVVSGVIAVVTVASQAPTQRASEIRLTLSEGTSFSAALSPDRQTLVLDLLGALWTLDVTGGPAMRILGDGYDAHAPAWSPDGKRIAFQAYRNNTWNIWTISPDGSRLTQMTAGPFDDREPHWSPDGARLAFSSDRGGTYDIWTLDLASGAPQQVTRDQANEFMPAWSPDGSELAYVSDREVRGIYANHLGSSTTRLIQADARTIAGPTWSPSGQQIAYVAYQGARSHLVVLSASGERRDLAEPTEDVFPFRGQFISDGELLYTADGQIKARGTSGGPARRIGFAADVAFTRTAFSPRVNAAPPVEPQAVRGIMRPAISPDGRQIVFAALGDLWISPAREGDVTPERITHDAAIDTDPAWSPDGTRLAFSSDRDGTMDLWIRELKTGVDRKLAPGAQAAAWAPNGDRLAYLDSQSQLQIVDVASGEVTRAHDRLNEPSRPSWLPGGRAVVLGALRPYSTRFREGTNQVIMIPIDTRTRAVSSGNVRWLNPVPHTSIGMREDFGPAWSPDGTQLAAIIDGYLSVLPASGGLDVIGKPRRLSAELANTPTWTRDSRSLLYQHAGGLGLVDVKNGRVRQIRPRLTWTPRQPTGRIVVHAGRLFDGITASAREDVDIIIDGNRIAAVEAHRDDRHRGTVLDAANHTVLPGLIESHTHLLKGFGEALGRAWLAFGVTSIRNPAANAYEALEEKEAIASGARIGPRVFATGEPFDGTRVYYPGGASFDDEAPLAARFARARELRFDLIKTYVRLPDGLQQRVIEEAHRAGLPVTSHEIYPAVAYGADGVEHIRGTSRRGYSPKMSELRRSYSDVIALLTASKMTLTPTIVIQGGFPILTLRDAWWPADPRLRLFPESVAAAGLALTAKPFDAADLAEREALVAPQEKMVAAVVRGGGRVIAGTDAPINPYGVSLLAELEHYVRGGLTPAEAMQTATIAAAEAIGVGAELGSIEPNKLADLIIVDGNPLEDITHLRRTRYTIKDGVVHEVDELIGRR